MTTLNTSPSGYLHGKLTEVTTLEPSEKAKNALKITGRLAADASLLLVNIFEMAIRHIIALGSVLILSLKKGEAKGAFDVQVQQAVANARESREKFTEIRHDFAVHFTSYVTPFLKNRVQAN